MWIITFLSVIINLFLMLLFIGPLILALYSIFRLYRIIITLLSTLFRRDLVQIVRERDSVFANDNITQSPSSIVLILVKLAGDMKLQDLEYSVTKFLFKMGNVSRENAAYAELLQYFVPWGGFMFKKWEANFDIKNHVREWQKPNGSPVTHDDLYDLRRKLLKEPYKAGLSPWEFILVRNLEKEREGIPGTEKETSIVIMKFHHGIVDGISFTQILISQNESFKTIGISQLKPLTFVQNLGTFLATFATAPSTLICQLPKIYPSNIFHPTNSKLTGKRHPVNGFLPVALVKQISKQTGTSFSAVLLTALTGGIRSYLKVKSKSVPVSIDLSIPLPWPGHPDKIGNHFTFVVLNIPTGLETPTERLQNMEKQFRNLKKSTTPALNFATVGIVGTLPLGIMSSILNNSPSSILMSNIPGPTTQATIFERSLIESLFEGGYGKAPLGMGVTMLSYNGVLSISINPDEGIIPTKADANQLLQSIANEFDILNDGSIV